MSFSGERFIFPENYETRYIIESDIFESAGKLSVQIAEAIDQEILNAIIKTARENGITDLIVLDKQFVLDALREKLERMKEDEHGQADDRV